MRISDSNNVRPFRFGPHIVQMLSVAFGVTSLVAFFVFLFTGPWKMLVLFHDTRAILAFDLCLSVAFFVQHSGMIRRSFRTWLQRFAPDHYHGAIFSIGSGICLYCVMVFWQVSELTLVATNDLWRLGVRVLFLGALGGVLWSNLALRSFDSFGLQAIRSHLRGKKPPVASFMERGPYRWVRHPQYFCILVMIWSSPNLTADRLLLNILWSAWVVIGTLLEERDLKATFGHRYEDYQSRVPMLVPYRAPH
jgi:protein-S-isoprenylcysteine O-methyltransferase Ste14